MTSKQLRKMNRTQLLELMRQQELEIERLSAEMEKLSAEKEAAAKSEEGHGSYPQNTEIMKEFSQSADNIAKAAREAAESVNSVKLFEEEKKAAAERIEQEARKKAWDIIEAAEQKLKDAELRAKGTADKWKDAADSSKAVAHLYIDFLNKAHDALHEMTERYGLMWLQEIKNSTETLIKPLDTGDNI